MKIIICRDCGAQIEALSRGKLRCADCNRVHKRQYMAAWQITNREHVLEQHCKKQGFFKTRKVRESAGDDR